MEGRHNLDLSLCLLNTGSLKILGSPHKSFISITRSDKSIGLFDTEAMKFS